MNLSLHDDGSTELMCDISRFFFGICDFAAGNPDVVARQDLLTLILVYLHDCLY